jgi:Transposase IS66 family
VQSGPNIQALAVYLTQGQLVPLARTGELLRDLYRLNISPATIGAWIDAAAQRVASSVEAVKESVPAVSVVGADESGLRADSKLQWPACLRPRTSPRNGCEPALRSRARETAQCCVGKDQSVETRFRSLGSGTVLGSFPRSPAPRETAALLYVLVN